MFPLFLVVLLISGCTIGYPGAKKASKEPALRPSGASHLIGGVVTPIKHCDGNWNFSQLRFEKCDGIPCTVHRGEDYMVEVDFVPTSNSNHLRMKFSVLIAGSEYPILDSRLEASSVSAGEAYVASVNIIPNDRLQGQLVTLRFALLDDKDQSQICIEFSVKIV